MNNNTPSAFLENNLSDELTKVLSAVQTGAREVYHLVQKMDAARKSEARFFQQSSPQLLILAELVEGVGRMVKAQENTMTQGHVQATQNTETDEQRVSQPVSM